MPNLLGRQECKCRSECKEIYLLRIQMCLAISFGTLLAKRLFSIVMSYLMRLQWYSIGSQQVKTKECQTDHTSIATGGGGYYTLSEDFFMFYKLFCID